MIRRIHHSEVFENQARIHIEAEQDCLNEDRDRPVEGRERITDGGSMQS